MGCQGGMGGRVSALVVKRSWVGEGAWRTFNECTSVCESIDCVRVMHSLDHPCTPHSLTHSLHHPCTHSTTHSTTHALTRPPCTHSLHHPCTHSLHHPCTHSTTHSTTHILTHFTTHAPTRPPMHSLPPPPYGSGTSSGRPRASPGDAPT